jgi:hypothetical protein
MGADTILYAAPKARGKVRGALPRTPPGGYPLDPRPAFPSAPCSRTVLAVKGALRKIFSNPEKIFLRRAQYARP